MVVIRGMELVVLPSAAEVARRAADRLAEVARRSTAPCVLLPAGRTPLALYAELRARVGSGELDLAHVHFFQLDELLGVAPDDERGFHAFLVRELLDPIEQPADRRHLLDGSAPDPARAIRAHADRLAELGGADLALLGLGPNGHVAFNEPGSRLEDSARTVELDARTRAGLAATFAPREGATPVTKPERTSAPTMGATLGLAEIASAREILVLVTGVSKRAILERVLTGPSTPDVPASLLARHHGVEFLADLAAAGELRSSKEHDVPRT